MRSNHHSRLYAVCIFVLLFLNRSFAQGTVQQILNNGPNVKRINIVFLSEGYTDSQLSRFIKDATNDLNSFLNTSPNSAYKNYFNAFAISIASIDSGSDHPSRSVYRNTYFNSTYDSYGTARLITIDGNGINNAFNLLQNLMPEYDIVVIIVNDPEYGGSGGTLSITSVNSSALEIATHELGHSFAGLGDEYSDAYPGYPETEEPNTTKEIIRENIKWNSWISNSTPIPTPKTAPYSSVVGLFEGAHYHSSGWYRPKLNCKMQALGVPFCEVCSETFVTSYYKFLRPIESFSPISPEIFLSDTQSVVLSITHLNPTGKSVDVEWFVDGIRRNGEKKSTFNIVAKDFGIGQHTAYCIVRDTTLLVRNDSKMLLRDSVSWKISVSGIADVFTESPDKTPNHFSLEQNFPNPFNPATTIAFTLPLSSFVTLKIYDIMGREIETLIAQEMSPGRFTQQWIASRLSGGIYVCELRAGNHKNTI